MEFGVLLFFVIVAILIRGLLKSMRSTYTDPDRRRRLQEITQRMRAEQRRRPGFPQPPGATYGREVGGPGFKPPPTAQPGSTAPFQPPPTARPGSTAPFRAAMPAKPMPTAPIAPPTPPFTAQWPSGAPTSPPQPPRFDPVVVEVAEDPAPESAYPTDIPTGGDSSPDVTGDVAGSTPRRGRYELSSSLDTTLSTSLTSSLIGEPSSVANGPQTVPLTFELQQQVLDLMRQGYEVAAVRLVCDEMNVGILDAHKTVRALAGLPTVL